jgi:LuxR family maltose regulon positive regulatory protein
MIGESKPDIPSTTPTGDPIMTSKFHVPPMPAWLVARQRLVDRLSTGVAGPLTIISGPAGSGKTVLAGSWVASGQPSGPVAWISLEAEDDQPGVFWSYVLAGLAHAGAPMCTRGAPVRADAVDRSLLIRLAVAITARPEPVVLVLDNAQVLTSRPVPDGLDFLIHHAEPHLRVVVLSRGDPPLALHRYRLAGAVTELRFDDLAFTATETQALLAAHGSQLADSAVAALTEHTHGWAAGLRLTARALPPRAAATGTHRGELADYFRAEVLAAQPAATREFMLRTSLVDGVWPALATELTGRRDAAQILAGLARDDAFVATAGEPGRYEYYPVARSLLREQLSREHPERVPPLHRRAAHWYALAGRPADALVHAAAAGDWQHAATLVVEDLSIARLMDGPRVDEFAQTFAAMPSDLATAEAAVVQAGLALGAGDTESGAKQLLRAHELTGDQMSERDWKLQLSIAVTDMVHARMCGHTGEARAGAETAETTIAHMTDRGIDVPADLRVLVSLSKAEGLLWTGEIAGAGRQLTSGLQDATGEVTGHLRAACLGRLAVVEALSGHLRRATDFGRRALQIADRSDLPMADRPPAAEVALAWVHADEYELAAARVHADRAAALLVVRFDPLAAGLHAVVRARVQRARGDLAGAVEAVDHAQADAAAMPAWLVELLSAVTAAQRGSGGAADVTAPDLADATTARGLMARATVRLASGDTAAAHRAAARLLGQGDLPLDVRVDGWLLTATAELAAGHRDRARSALDRALTLAEAERLRRPVLEAPPRLRRFMRQERDITRRHDWLGAHALDPVETVDLTSTVLVIEPLTAKETEVLGYLAALLSTEEIARTMFVSVNTIKTHVRGVLRKLAASRRNEAVRRARELGLI